MENLTFEQARDLIQDGDIIFFKSVYSFKHPLDALIMFATGSPFVHCNFAFWAELGGNRRLMAVEAQGGTSRRVINESYYQDKLISIKRAVVPWDTIANDALSRVAVQKYGYLTAVYAGLRDFFIQRFGIKLPKMSHPGEICSEFCARLSGLEDTDISPGTLYKLLP